jgi:proteasome assembly chaperone (PAC2) family protein
MCPDVQIESWRTGSDVGGHTVLGANESWELIDEIRSRGLKFRVSSFSLLSSQHERQH